MQRSTLQLLRIEPVFADLYRSIRLNALRSDLLAFGSTYERESLLTPEGWLKRAISLDGKDKIGFILTKTDQPCGLVACFRDSGDSSRGQVISMWIDPTERRRGLAMMLLEAVRVWAKSQQISTLQLLVTVNNTAALALYRRVGFRETGRIELYPNDSRLHEVEMERSTEFPIEAGVGRINW